MRQPLVAVVENGENGDILVFPPRVSDVSAKIVPGIKNQNVPIFPFLG